jgi:ParB family chromosome partitioning protein
MVTTAKSLRPNGRAKTQAPACLQCPIEKLRPHPFNPRGPIEPDSVEDLLASVRQDGVIVPLIVVAKKSAYLIVCGHRRHKAAQLAKLKTLPIIVKDLSPIEQEEMMLLENLQRRDLSPLQEARAFERLIEQGLSRMEIARRLGVIPERINQRLLILKLSLPVQEMFGSSDLPITSVPFLAKIVSPKRQEEIAGLLASRELTVPQLKEVMARMDGKQREDETLFPVTRLDHSNGAPLHFPLPNGHRPSSRRRRKSVYSLEQARRDLERAAGRFWARDDLLLALESVCGPERFDQICKGCPLPDFVRALTKEWS